MPQTTSANLSEAFERAASEVAAVVEHTPRKPRAVCDAIERITDHAANIVVGGGEFLPPALFEAVRAIPGVNLAPTDEQLAGAPVGVTDAFAGIASSGSVCIAMGAPYLATASLLMPLHIVLLPVERIVPRPRDIFDPGRFGGEGLRRNLVFVTGPSATADMGKLVRGVHGPHRIHILLLDEG
jgi:L-lactate dehydrogenase complex protein LldG